MKTIKIYGGIATAILAGGTFWALLPVLWYLALLIMVGGTGYMLIFAARLFLPVYVQATAAKTEQAVKLSDMRLRDRVIAIGERPGYSTKYEVNGTIEVIASVQRRVQIDESAERDNLEIEAPKIPQSVRYEDIRFQIPKDHALIGVAEGGMVHTLEKEVKGLVWIPGSSGAGKSNTTGLRVEEDYERGHRFLGIDPHFFKDDSLSNLVRGYMDRFMEPIAHSSEDILHMLNLFIAEVDRRKTGGACWPLTLLYDEIGSQVSDKPEDEIEKQIIEKTKKVIRLAGQETRGFNMNVIAISQDAAGLAFLRKRALLVLGHKTVMMSERELVCNGRTDIARQMDLWPVGRTVVYGVAVAGVLVRQQPLMTAKTVSSGGLPKSSEPISGRPPEDNGEDAGRDRNTEEDATPLVLKKFLNEAGKMRAQGESLDSILKRFNLTAGGRNNQNLKALLEQEGI
jgi:hypothetical protein